jgi:hypothetical protein
MPLHTSEGKPGRQKKIRENRANKLLQTEIALDDEALVRRQGIADEKPEIRANKLMKTKILPYDQ